MIEPVKRDVFAGVVDGLPPHARSIELQSLGDPAQAVHDGAVDRLRLDRDESHRDVDDEPLDRFGRAAGGGLPG